MVKPLHKIFIGRTVHKILKTGEIEAFELLQKETMYITLKLT
jgi:hypothetical protein